ncbi:protein SDA1-like protein, partial [Leptotrombidium deliense]
REVLSKMRNRVNNQLPNNLPQLQNCIKRDPQSYREEFLQQHNHYKALIQVFQCNPSSKDKHFEDLIMFLAQISHCYTEDLKDFPNELMNLLKVYSTVLSAETRLAICKALILLRNKALLSAIDILNLFFELFKCEDKGLRTFLKNHIISDIKNMNSKHKDAKTNSALQNFMFSMLKESNIIAAKMAIEILVELYHKNVWKDAKVVNVIADCCFSKITKILVASVKFFLGKDEEKAEDSDSDSDNEDLIKDVTMANRFNKNSRKRKRLLERTKKVVKKSKKGKKVEHYDFSAIHMLYDPQGMAEKLYKSLEKLNEKFEVKLMVIDLISRLIGIHQLFVFNFYPLVCRYLTPKQREVTKLLLYAAQAAHELVPPETMEPVLKTIANNFVSERNSSECITVGLNAIRELCSRCPLVMTEDLLHDLAEYRNYKNKNVSMAAKSVVQLFRVINPSLLKKKDRAKPTEATEELTVKQYGELDAKEFVPGAECLTEEPNEDEEEAEEKNNGSDSDSEGWVDVGSDNEDVDIEESDEESESEEDERMDEETEKKEDGNKESDKATKASMISASRILTAAEFKKIRNAQLAKQVKAAQPKRFGKNSKEVIDTSELESKGELVELTAIERLYKRSRRDKESRLSTVMEGREGREKFGRRKGKMSEFASKTEKERKKNKAFTMIKHKVNSKKKRSFQEKHRALKSSLLKQMKARKK